MTNAEKFREVFGFTPDWGVGDFLCIAPKKVCDEFETCIGCPFNGWLSKEYKACCEINPEFEGVK